MKLEELIQSNHFEQTETVCPGCSNHCQVRQYTFANGNTYYSGNNCERVYSNNSEAREAGVNLMKEKYHLLFDRASVPLQQARLTVGIPRGLGIYEDYPFWHTLFTCCNIRVVLSGESTNRLYEKGLRTIVADNICFPAKLMHGHVMTLVERKVDRIFYPWVVYEQPEDEGAKNSFNCPIVSGYSDVLKSAVRTEEKYGIPLDSPTISFKEERLLRESVREYMATLGVDSATADNAVTQALAEQRQYLQRLEERNLQVYAKAESEGRMVIVLAARPYHIDPLIQHRIAEYVSSMGIDVLTENVAAHAGNGVYAEMNALSQWAYPNRIFKAADWVGKAGYTRVHMVQLTSFGCGPDAFILDEVRLILGRYHKNLTVLKIDDVNNIGSLKLRIRSLVESVRKVESTSKEVVKKTDAWTTKPFETEDRRRVILAPYFAEGYNEFLPTIFALAGYRLVPLEMGTQPDAEMGLQVANNDICYPATIVVGSILRALKSGKYDLENTAVAITQTGGQCRASNYYSLIKNALVQAGFAHVPVVSVAIGPDQRNTQPGFVMPWKKLIRPVLESLFFADALAKLYYPAAPREKEQGKARMMYDHYLSAVQPLVLKHDYKGMRRLMKEAVRVFTELTNAGKEVTKVGVVGEIYVKYNSFSNKGVVKWLVQQGVEVVPPALTGFFSTTIPNAFINRKQHIRSDSMAPWQAWMLNKVLRHYAHVYDKLCADYPLYQPFVDIMEVHRLSRQVINSAADFGEGWFLPGEICHLAEHGVNKVVSLQPFGCIANHIISKGIERRYKECYPNLSLLFLDFDAGTSEANITNRLHFMLAE